MLEVEQWELAPTPVTRPLTRAVSNIPQLQTPTKIQDITIIPNTVPGTSLILQFHKIFLRPAVPAESDITFTGQDLSNWAADFWQSLS